jgi:hypothetical protein
MPDQDERPGGTNVRLAMLRKRISLCRKVLARLHNTYIAEMDAAQIEKNRLRAGKRTNSSRVV